MNDQAGGMGMEAQQVGGVVRESLPARSNFFFWLPFGVGTAGSVLGGWKGRRWSYSTPSDNDWVWQGPRQGWRAGMARVSVGKRRYDSHFDFTWGGADGTVADSLTPSYSRSTAKTCEGQSCTRCGKRAAVPRLRLQQQKASRGPEFPPAGSTGNYRIHLLVIPDHQRRLVVPA